MLAILIAFLVLRALGIITRPEKNDEVNEPAPQVETPLPDTNTPANNVAGESAQVDTVGDTGDGTIEEQDDSPESDDSLIILPAGTTEGRLQESILKMNDTGYQQAGIHLFEENYSPAQRNTSLKWDQSVFYTLEGIINGSGYCNKINCGMLKKRLINLDTGNIIDYEIYLNPEFDVPNKIVSIEYIDSGLEIYEYYYDNDGKVSFIFHYLTDNYISTYATPDKYGERYLFDSDVMVTWRIIDESGTINYSVGANEKERMKNQFSNIKLYAALGEKLQKKFGKTEKNMINAAYNTLNLVMNAVGFADIEGYVYDGDSSGIGEALVDLYDNGFSNRLFVTKTDSNGHYHIIVPDNEYSYNLRVRKTGMKDCSLYAIDVKNERIGIYQDAVYLYDRDNEEQTTVDIQMGDAFNYASNGNGMAPLVNALIIIREGINNHFGPEVFRTTGDANGFAILSLKPGMYTAEIIASGYETMYYTFAANPHVSGNHYEFYASPELAEGEIAIVLTWGYQPSDLDSHLFTTKSSTSHIWYGGSDDSFGSYLDVDDTTSYGPETVTIRQFSRENYYKYCVVDFTECSAGEYDSTKLSESGAIVSVYGKGGLLTSLRMPTGVRACIWEVLEIRNGAIIPIQRYYDNVTDKSWWNSDK